MNSEKDYQQANKELWNERTSFHLTSDFYNQNNFIKTRQSLKSIELNLLGNIKRKSVLHLQCHFGQDTISLGEMGADATGVDFSENAIRAAKEIAEKLDVSARFICSDVYSLPSHLDEKFDIVFTSYGVIGWLPDLERWAACIAHFLKPGGKLVFAEFHPFVWMFDENFSRVTYNYFKDEAILENEKGTYADADADIELKSVSWNHSISEVLTALISNGLTITHFQEYNYSPYKNFKNMEEIEKGKYIITKLGNKIPLIYALVAEKS